MPITVAIASPNSAGSQVCSVARSSEPSRRATYPATTISEGRESDSSVSSPVLLEVSQATRKEAGMIAPSNRRRISLALSSEEQAANVRAPEIRRGDAGKRESESPLAS